MRSTRCQLVVAVIGVLCWGCLRLTTRSKLSGSRNACLSLWWARWRSACASARTAPTYSAGSVGRTSDSRRAKELLGRRGVDGVGGGFDLEHPEGNVLGDASLAIAGAAGGTVKLAKLAPAHLRGRRTNAASLASCSPSRRPRLRGRARQERRAPTRLTAASARSCVSDTPEELGLLGLEFRVSEQAGAVQLDKLTELLERVGRTCATPCLTRRGPRTSDRRRRCEGDGLARWRDADWGPRQSLRRDGSRPPRRRVRCRGRGGPGLARSVSSSRQVRGSMNGRRS